MKRLLILSLALVGCESMQQPTHLAGPWGGPHIGLVFEAGMGKLEYDCAAGTIDTVVVPDPDGHFQATGTHIPGHGGPVRVGEIFRSHRATYRGRIQGDVMELSAVLDNGVVVGPFTLQRGAEPQIMRCL